MDSNSGFLASGSYSRWRAYIVAVTEEVEEFVVGVLEVGDSIIVIVCVDVIWDAVTVRILKEDKRFKTNV